MEGAARPSPISPTAAGGGARGRWRKSTGSPGAEPGSGGDAGAAAEPRMSYVRPSPYAEVLRAARASACEDPTSPRAAAARLAPPSPAPQRALSPEPEGAAASTPAAAEAEEEEEDYARDLERLVDAAADNDDSPFAAGALESLQGILDYTLRCACCACVRCSVTRRAGARGRRGRRGAAGRPSCLLARHGARPARR